MGSKDRIASLEDIPTESTFLFTIEERDTGEEIEAIALRVDDGPGNGTNDETTDSVVTDDEEANDAVVGWLNYCQHLTHIRLDKGSGAPTRNGEIVCANHGATFERDSGLCTYGPCEGAYLNGVEVAVENGDVYLDDPDYEFVTTGPIERDPIDLSSTSNVEF